MLKIHNKLKWLRTVHICTETTVQWLRLCLSNAGGTALTPGQGTKIPCALWPKREKKKIYDLKVLKVSVLHGSY